ncbi:hybrid sensor histidine kinase/response regulator transcription factor [Saccharobesus litoralis]|uniref:hybrid sensor histidine kinase/response regulator transcription factor n=1 Tax=Saccharobesus litoralis TaxID=2172099 RepID=UPI00131F4306|nr:hybrid sensor histidine kinase/response regulator transcription factor [Saccharobesus litoralis]
MILIVLVTLPSTFASQQFYPVFPNALESDAKWHKVENIPNRLIKSADFGPNNDLWFATSEGVYQFDGYQGQWHNSENGLNVSEVQAIKWLGDKLYIVSFDAIYTYDGKQWQQIGESFEFFPEHYTHQIVTLAADSKGDVWFSAQQHVVQIKQNNYTVYEVEDKFLASLTLDTQDNIWTLDGRSGHVRQYKLKNHKLNQQKIWRHLMRPKAQLVLPFNGVIQQLSDGSIWVTSSENSHTPKYLNPNSQTENQEFTTVRIPRVFTRAINHSLLQVSNGDIYITSGNDILFSRDLGKTWQKQDIEQHRLDTSFLGHMLLESNDNRLWLLEPGISIKRFPLDLNKPHIYPNMLYQCNDSDNRQYFIDDQDNIIQFDVSSDTWNRYSPQDTHISKPNLVYCTRNGRVWAAGSDQQQTAISYLRGNKWYQQQHTPLETSIHYQATLETERGDIYFGNSYSERKADNGYIIKLNNEDNVYRAEQVLVDYPKVSKIIPWDQDSILLSGHRLRFINKGAYKAMESPPELKKGWIEDVLKTQENGLWAATWGGGISQYKDSTWSQWDSSNGLPTNNITNLMPHGDSILALSDRGVLEFNTGTWYLRNYAGAKGKSQSSNLLKSNDNSIWVTQFPRMWVHRDFRKFNLKVAMASQRYYPDYAAPQTQIKLMQSLEAYDSSVYVSWQSTDKWSTTANEDLFYQYKLNDQDWSPSTSDTTLLLSRLLPDDYVLQVRARDAHGNIENTPAELRFTISLPFWQSAWFTALLIITPIIIGLLLVALLVQRIKHVTKLDQVRLRFLTNISHELRTPLTLILGPLQKVRKDLLPEDPKLKSLDLAIENSQRLNELVDQLLDFRKTQLGAVILNPQHKNLVAFTRMLVNNFENLTEGQHQHISFSCNQSSYICNFDPDAYRKVLENLVVNAIKYSDAGATTKVELHIDPDKHNKVRLTVEDQGYGINPNAIDNIFDPFYSGNQKLDTNFTSFGVGLALVKELVEAQNGSINVISPVPYQSNSKINNKDDSGDNPGTRFTIEFNEWHQITPPTVPTETKTDSGATNDDQVIVLLIDDHPSLTEYLADELNDHYRVETAESAEQGFKIATELVPDIIVSDVMMPGGMDGLELCELLKKTEVTNHIPVILLTSLSSKEHQEQGLKIGALDYLTKPVSTNVLTAKIENHLASRKALAQKLTKQLANTNNVSKSETASTEPLATEEPTPQLSTAEQKFIQRFSDIIAKNFANSNYTAEVLAQDMNMSRSAFYRKFKAYTDQSPADYLKNYRLDKAIELLHDPDCVVNHIAEHIGYAEQSPFYRAFKKRFGCTPTEYKKRHLL